MKVQHVSSTLFSFVVVVEAIVGIAAAGQAGAEVAREREPAAVSESQGWGSCWLRA